ncbi:MAG: tetratricopeptide repeat protein [Bacteroidia bacterium]
MHFVFFGLMLLISSISYAQVNVDSLFAIWQDEKLEDTVRLNAMHQIAFDYHLFNDADSALYYANEQYEFAAEKGLKKQMGLALNTIGNSYSIQRKFTEAESFYNQSLAVRTEINDQRGIAGNLINLGTLFMLQSQYTKALKYLKKGIVVCDEINEKQFKANALGSIAAIYLSQEELGLAKKYLLRCLELYKEKSYKRFEASYLVSLAYIANSEGDFDQSLTYYLECLEIANKNDDNFHKAQANLGIGIALFERKEYNKAINYLRRSRVMSEKLGDRSSAVESIVQIGKIKLHTNAIDSAISLCNLALEKAHQIETILNKKGACECLYEAHKKQGDGNTALIYHEMLMLINDSLKEDETSKQLQQMEFDKQLVKDSLERAETIRLEKEKEAKLLAIKTRKNRIQYSAVIIIVLLLATTLAIVTKFKISPRLASGLIFIFFILTFEFLLVVLDPWVDSVSNGEVGWKIAINTAIALVLFGIHQVSEKKLKTSILKVDR